MRVLPPQARPILELVGKRTHRRNPGWIMRNHPYRVRQLDYGTLRQFLHYEATNELRVPSRVPDELYYAGIQGAYIGNGAYTDLTLDWDAIGYLQPFYWMNGTHLILPDIVDRMRGDGQDAWEWHNGERVDEAWVYNWEGGWEFEEFGHYEGHQIPDAAWTWWDLHGWFYVVPDGKIAGISFRTPQMLNVDHHPTVQMSLYGLLLALRQEDVIIPETIIATITLGWLGPEDVWEHLINLAGDNQVAATGDKTPYLTGEIAEPFMAQVWNKYVRESGASDAALWPNAQSLGDLSEEDLGDIMSYFNQDDEFMPMTMERAGSMIETLAAGPYTCNVRYTPAPWVPGYAPGFIPGAAPPLDLQPPPEVYGQYGGPELPPPEAHPSATHSPKLRLGDPLEQRRKRG